MIVLDYLKNIVVDKSKSKCRGIQNVGRHAQQENVERIPFEDLAQGKRLVPFVGYLDGEDVGDWHGILRAAQAQLRSGQRCQLAAGDPGVTVW